jgi:hypothetical protein
MRDRKHRQRSLLIHSITSSARARTVGGIFEIHRLRRLMASLARTSPVAEPMCQVPGQWTVRLHTSFEANRPNRSNYWQKSQ